MVKVVYSLCILDLSFGKVFECLVQLELELESESRDDQVNLFLNSKLLKRTQYLLNIQVLIIIKSLFGLLT